MAKKLIPADPDRCQTMHTSYHPFIMGGSTHREERCPKPPVLIVTERKAGKDRRKGSMSMCAACFVAFAASHKVDDYELKAVEGVGR